MDKYVGGRTHIQLRAVMRRPANGQNWNCFKLIFTKTLTNIATHDETMNADYRSVYITVAAYISHT